jgi:hypothetical protein
LEVSPNLQSLTLEIFRLGDDDCRALATAGERTEIHIKLCLLRDTGREAFVDLLQANQGPTHIDGLLGVGTGFLAQASRGNTRIQSLTTTSNVFRDGQDNLHNFSIFIDSPTTTSSAFDNLLTFPIFIDMLSENEGLLQLQLGFGWSIGDFNDKNWSALCRALQRHPTLMDLGFSRQTRTATSDEKIAHRMRSIADMLNSNTVLVKLGLAPNECDMHIARDLIQPRLQTNLLHLKCLPKNSCSEQPFSFLDASA